MSAVQALTSISRRTSGGSAASESDTLLASPSSNAQDYGTAIVDPLDRELDKPVDLRGFYRNVRRCKIVFGLFLPLCLGLEVAHLLSILNFPGPPRTALETAWYIQGHTYADVGGFALLTIVTLLWFAACIKSVDVRSATDYRNYGLHRTFCSISFSFLALVIAGHLAPYIGYVMITKRAPLEYVWSWQNPTNLNRARMGVLVAALLTSGTTRRGPKLRFDPMRIGTGFGMTAAEKDKKADGKVDKEEMNVIDYLNCSLLDFMSLSYISPIAIKSHVNGKLYQSDLPHLEYVIRNAGVGASLWDEGSIKIGEDGKPIKHEVTGYQLIKLLWAGVYGTVMWCLVLETTKQIFSFMQMAAMHEIIETFKVGKGEESAYAYLMCWGLFLGQAIEVVMGTWNGVRENYLLHQPIRMTLSSLLFSKILRSTDAKAAEAHNMSDDEKEHGKGRSQVMNLLTMDTGVIASLATKIWNTTNAIISLVIGVYFLYVLFGVSAFVGIACIPLTSPLGWFIAKNIYRCDKTYLRVRDARIGAIKEFLLTIKVVKLNAWEPHFRRNIQRLRDIEVVWQRWRFTLGTLFNIQADQLPVLTILVTFTFHTKILGRPLDPAAAFVALGVFNRVKDSLGSIPSTLNAILEAKVAINRLTAYLNQPEVEELAHEEVSEKIQFENATIGWPSGEKSELVVELTTPFTLKDVNLELPQKKFTLVVGPLGSGKTLFLRALLGEATVEEGQVRAPRSKPDATPVYGRESKRAWTEQSWLNDSVSYAPQQAFIRHGTIRDNITFGQPLWMDRYKEALRQACLVEDLKLMPDGDMTEVGEHGVTLSGGQKARINLARCIYSRAKTVFMDDILSAVDAHTAQYIFEECLTSGLLQGRTLVLVTHHVPLCLPGADFFVSLRDGYVEQACPAKDATITDMDLAELSPTDELHEDPMLEAAERIERRFSTKQKDIEEQERVASSRNIYTAEASATGRVAMNHYWMFAIACGGIFYWVGLLLLLFGSKGFDVWRSVWVQQWTSDNDPDHLNYYLLWYASLSTLAVIFGAIRWIWLYGVGKVGFYNRGSRRIHSMLLDSICNAPLSFFEKTPGGRLMNIFGQDTGRMDAYVADDFGRCVMQVLSIGAALVIVCMNSPLLILIFAGLAIPFFWISGVLGQLRADLRRLTAICFTPLISLYHDTIDGVVMVRAFGSNDLAYATLNTIMNQEKEATVADWTVYSWVRCVMQTMTATVVSACGFMLVGGNFSASQAGFILAYALEVSQGLFSLLEQFSSFEQTFVSAERINYYIQMEDQEPTTGIVPPPDWPSQGAISFKNLSHRYAPDLPDVLKNISFDVEPGMRVGLVGSTGSGKSTLALTLFRAVEPSGGSITIDGIDIKDITLPSLRGSLNMVAQDGSLCSGTLRDALDVSGEKDDAEIYEALRRVHLLPEADDESIKENPFANLETFVAIEGANFSQGQRQLLCLARALLKKSKILVMDEATSSVDFEMDAKITQTIKECFAGTTMLVIAHRLATIIHFDRVLVLDKGQIKEYGRPVDLISNEKSAFHGLCQAQGPEEFEKLVAMAKA